MTKDTSDTHTRPGTDRVPLSFAQQRLWFLDQLEPDGSEYLIRRAMRLVGPVDVAALEHALTEVVARHETLRTRFAVAEDGRPWQVVDPPTPVPVSVVDLSGRDSADVYAAVHAAAMPFDLATGPLLRAVLVRSGPDTSVLLICVHHIVFDGLSESVLARELGALYAAATGGVPAGLPAPPVRYADYAVWQHRRLTDQRLRKLLDYWRDRLAGLLPLRLPTDRPRRAVRGTAGDAVRLTVPADTLRMLSRTAGKAGATLFMALLGGFQVLLARYSGQDDIAVGTAISDRTLAGTEHLIGLFVNSLVLRTDLSGDPTFAELLGRVRDTALGAFGHLDLPFERLVDELAPERDLSRNPLFDAMLVLQRNPPGSAWRLAGVEVEPFPLDAPDSETDLTVHLTQQDDGSATGWLYFSTELFDRSTVQRMCGHLLALLHGFAQHPDVPISEIGMISAAERERVLVEWNDTDGEFPAGLTLHELLAEQAVARPDAPAVVCGDVVLTHGELAARACRLAHHLRDHRGVVPGVLVGVFLDRRPELVVALLAILKAGGAYVPLDPEHPAERIAFLLADTAARLVITQADLATRLPRHTDRLLVDTDWPSVAGYPATEPAPLATPRDLAYVIYTSGSTGRPKGVMVEHGGVVNYLAGMQREFPLRPGEGFLQATPLSFDVSAYEIFWPLWQGGTVVLVPGGTRLDMARVSSLLREHRIVGLHFVPSLLDMFVNQVDPADCAALRYAFCSGEALPGGLVRRFADRFPGDLVNLYGATEVSVDTTYWRAEPDVPVLAGRPMLNQAVYVLDAAGQPVPVGVVGEVHLGGRCVGRGYLNRPGLTAERFRSDPFRADGRMYRTGDLGRFTADGDLDLLGRADSQIKLRGVRVELGEIESALLADVGVAACAVVVREDATGDRHLVAYCVPADGELDVAALRESCRRTLPPVMVPAVFLPLPALPLTTNGKIDRKRLPTADFAHLATGTAHVAPRDEVETALAEVWADVLGVDRVGVHDDFFEAGGHSLRAVQLVNQVERLTGIRVSLRGLFLSPTIVGIKTQLLALIEDQS